MSAPLRIGFVPGVIPDKWAQIWRRRLPESPLELVPLDEETDPRAAIDDGRLDMCFVRLPVDRDGLHLIPLWEEVPVVVVDVEHPVAELEELPVEDLAGEQLVVGDVPNWEEIRTATPLPFPPMSTREAIEVVASGTGVAIVPMSIARLHHRKDVVHRPVTGVPTTRIGLAWLVSNEDDRLQTFIGIVRGRRAGSSRENPPAPTKKTSRGSGKDTGKSTPNGAGKGTGKGAARGTRKSSSSRTSARRGGFRGSR